MNKGFTLIELLISITIFVMVSGLVLANFPSFSSRIVLDNLAHEIALTIREAQVFGIGVLETGAGLFPSYGVYFDTSTLENSKKFILFADIDESGQYNKGEEIEIFTITKGNKISALCGDMNCTPDNFNLDELHITFVRPDPEAILIGVSGVLDTTPSFVKIVVTQPEGSSRTITVWSTGQISAQ